MKRFLLSLVFGLGGLLALSACQPDPPCQGPGGPGGPTYSAGGVAAPGQALDDCPPLPDCPGCGEGSGEPHQSTFDERHYSLQTAAELVASRSDDGRFEVQWRQEPIGDHVSGITAVAVRITEDRITVVGDGEVLRIDGDVVELEVGQAFRTVGGTLVHRLEDRIGIQGPDGEGAVHLNLHPTMMGVLVDPPDDDRGSLEGLLGDADGDSTNDLVLADGSLLIEETWEDLHPGLAEAWRVTDDTTLFDYEDGLGPDDYWDPTFPAQQIRIEDFSDDERATAEEACRAAGVTGSPRLERCTFDVLVLDDPGAADLAARQQQAAGLELEPQTGGGTGDPEDDDPAELADILVSWSALVPTTGDPTSITLVGDVLVAQTLGTERDRSLLIGLSADDGEEFWRVEGIYAHATVAVDGDEVIAVALGKGPLGGPDDSPALVTIDATTGELVEGRRYDRQPGERAFSNATSLVPLDDVVIAVSGGWILAYDLADLTPVWQTELDGGNSFELVTLDDTAWLGWRYGEGTRIGQIDASDGTVEVLAEVDGRIPARRAAVGTPDGGLVVSVTHGEERMLALGPDGEERWEVAFEGDEYGPRWLTVAGDTVAGYTDGQEIQAFDLDDGSALWTARPSSFNNNHSQVLGLEDGTVVLGSFGGAHLEAFGPDGEEAWQVPAEAILVEGTAPSVHLVGPLVGDDVIAISKLEGGLVVVAVPTAGPRDR